MEVDGARLWSLPARVAFRLICSFSLSRWALRPILHPGPRTLKTPRFRSGRQGEVANARFVEFRFTKVKFTGTAASGKRHSTHRPLSGDEFEKMTDASRPFAALAGYEKPTIRDVQVQGNCAAISRSVPWNAVLGP